MRDTNYISDYFKSLAKKRWKNTSEEEKAKIMEKARAGKAMRRKDA